jgi:hypothetical protein
MNDPLALNITLNPDGVSARAYRVTLMASQVVGTCLRALDVDSCEDQNSWGTTFGYQFGDLGLTPTERREAFRNWIIAKGFQDLARGIRESLEEALFFIRMMEKPRGVLTTWASVQAEMDNIRSKSAKLNFPNLMQQVNASLREPMAFDAEFGSMQKVRNCLEHRGGRTARQDVDPATGILTLSFPRLKAFYLRGGEEVEVLPGAIIDTQSSDTSFGKEDVQIHIRRVTRSRAYSLDEPVVINASDFYEIAFASYLFAADVASKLPKTQDTAARIE